MTGVRTLFHHLYTVNKIITGNFWVITGSNHQSQSERIRKFAMCNPLVTSATQASQKKGYCGTSCRNTSICPFICESPAHVAARYPSAAALNTGLYNKPMAEDITSGAGEWMFFYGTMGQY